MTTLQFRVDHRETGSAARTSTLITAHGEVALPAFMPVGTQGTVKGLTPRQLRDASVQMVLANTYHLALRPGEEVVRQLGGLHRFMGVDCPILTDSGGFQIFSLAGSTKVTDHAAVFRSHIDGERFEMTPERAIAIQEALSSDVAMVLDDVVPLPCESERVAEAAERTVQWAARCKEAHRRVNQALFAIVQGGLDETLRVETAERLVEIGFDGYAIGGLSVGESPEAMLRTLEATVPALPEDRPRYLMGVGRPVDLLEAIHRGIDLFDCVLPTRNGRNAVAFTDSGLLRLRNLRFADEERPLEEGCPCEACRHSRGYLRHLFLAREMLGPVLVSLHNVTYYQRLMKSARSAIAAGGFAEFRQLRLKGWSVSAANGQGDQPA